MVVLSATELRGLATISAVAMATSVGRIGARNTLIVFCFAEGEGKQLARLREVRVIIAQASLGRGWDFLATSFYPMRGIIVLKPDFSLCRSVYNGVSDIW